MLFKIKFKQQILFNFFIFMLNLMYYSRWFFFNIEAKEGRGGGGIISCTSPLLATHMLKKILLHQQYLSWAKDTNTFHSSCESLYKQISNCFKFLSIPEHECIKHQKEFYFNIKSGIPFGVKSIWEVQLQCKIGLI